MARREFGQHVSAARNCSPVLALEREAGDLVDELRKEHQRELPQSNF